MTAALPRSLLVTHRVATAAAALTASLPFVGRSSQTDPNNASTLASSPPRSATTGMLEEGCGTGRCAGAHPAAQPEIVASSECMPRDPSSTPSDASGDRDRASVGTGRPEPTTGPTDEDLLVRSREGDRAAFQSLVERYREDLLRFLYRFLGSRAAADDVFQESFLQVHLAADTFDAERRFRPWLFAIAANKARDHHRRQRRRAMSSLTGPVGDGDASLVDLLEMDAPAPGAPSESSELQVAVQRVVDELPNHYREILLLAYFQKMSYQQIAECLSIPLGTVKSRLHAAVASFATSWKGANDHV